MPPGSSSGASSRGQAALRGKQVAVLEPGAYGGYKDVSEAWAAGVLSVGVGRGTGGTEMIAVPEALCEAWAERVAIMTTDGGVPRTEAERLAWAALEAQRAVW